MAEPMAFYRTGQCTLGCGACCRTVSLLVKAERMTQEYAMETMQTHMLLAHPSYHDVEDVRHWLELHGFSVGKEGDESRISIPSDVLQARFRWTDHGVLVDLPRVCSALGPDGMCTIFGQPERPQVCALYPQAPQDIELMGAVCTFAFEVAH